MQFPPVSRHIIPLRTKYSPQRPVLKHPQSMWSNELRGRNSELKRPDEYRINTTCSSGDVLRKDCTVCIGVTHPHVSMCLIQEHSLRLNMTHWGRMREPLSSCYIQLARQT
jgi:hypothetical protein